MSLPPISEKNEFVFLVHERGFKNVTKRPTITSNVESALPDTDLKLEESMSPNDTHQNYHKGINPDDDEDVHSALGRWLGNI